MRTIKEIFDVELEEKFKIADDDGNVWENCYFDKNKELVFPLLDIAGPLLLVKLISGKAKIVKKLNKKEKEKK